MEKTEPRPERTIEFTANDDDIPLNLGDALDLLADCAPLQEVLSPDFCKVYESVKRDEFKEFQQVISPWEREHLLLNV